MLTRSWLTACTQAYVGDRDPSDPLVSPVFADLAGLPPTIVFSATHDMLAPAAAAFTKRARAAGVDVEHVEERGLWHDYPLQAGLIAAGDAAVERVAQLLQGTWRSD